MKIEFRSNGLIVDGNRISNIEICSICPLYTPENLERLAAIEVSVKAAGYAEEIVAAINAPIWRKIVDIIPPGRFWGSENLNSEIDDFLIHAACTAKHKKIFFRDNGMHRLSDGNWVFVAGNELIGKCGDYAATLSPKVAALQLACDSNVDKRAAIIRVVREIEKNMSTIFTAFCYTFLSSFRQQIGALGLSIFPVLYVTGRQGWGKTVLVSRYCLLYDAVADCKKWGQLEGNSTPKGIMHEISESENQVILVDDLAKASDMIVQRERAKVFAEVLRFAANGHDRKTASAARNRAILQCRTGVAFTGELPLTAASDVTRSIQIELEAPMSGGLESDRANAAVTFRSWIQWILPRFDDEINQLRKQLVCVNGGADARLGTTGVLLNWSAELFFRFLYELDIVDSVFYSSAVDKAKSVFDNLLAKQRNAVNRIQDIAPQGNLSWYILKGYREQAFHIVSNRKEIRQDSDCFIENDSLCIRQEALLEYLHRIPAFCGLGEKQLSKKLRDEGALTFSKEKRSAGKRIGRRRYLSLNFSLLKSAAQSYT